MKECNLTPLPGGVSYTRHEDIIIKTNFTISKIEV